MMPAFPEERQRLLLEVLGREGKIVASVLAERLGVSEDTVRRDIRELAEAGRLLRVHGGALPITPARADFTRRAGQGRTAKAALAARAAALIRPGQVVMVDSGTTTLEIARALPPGLAATIVTTSPPVAVALAGHPEIEIVVIGGRLLKSALATGGAAALDGIRRMRTDLCLLGVCSLHAEAGIGAVDLEEAHLKRAMIENAAETVAVVTADKLGTASPCTVAPLTALSRLITEAVPDSVLEPYRAAGIAVETV